MDMEEKVVIESLHVLGFEVKEVSRRELDLSYIALKDKYSNNSKILDKVTFAYETLTKDIRVTNEVIRNILDPSNKTYFYQEDKNKENEVKENINPEVVDVKPNMNKEFGEVKINDKPSAFIFILSLLAPFYGILNYSFLKRIMPKSSKLYLLAGILGFVLYIGLLVFLALNSK